MTAVGASPLRLEGSRRACVCGVGSCADLVPPHGASALPLKEVLPFSKWTLCWWKFTRTVNFIVQVRGFVSSYLQTHPKTNICYFWVLGFQASPLYSLTDSWASQEGDLAPGPEHGIALWAPRPALGGICPWSCARALQWGQGVRCCLPRALGISGHPRAHPRECCW